MDELKVGEPLMLTMQTLAPIAFIALAVIVATALSPVKDVKAPVVDTFKRRP